MTAADALTHHRGAFVDHEHMGADLAKVLLTEEQIQARLAELAADDRRRLRRARTSCSSACSRAP